MNFPECSTIPLTLETFSAAVQQNLATYVDLRLFQQSGSELVYTNTLHSVKTRSVVRRKPILVLPLACRIPSVQVMGPQYQMSIPTEEQTFGLLRFWIEVFQPGDGPMKEFTGNPRFRTDDVPNRVRRNVQRSAISSRFNYLDLHVMSNCSILQAEMITRCLGCPTNDYRNCKSLIEQGSVTHALIPAICSINFICVKAPVCIQMTFTVI